MHEACAHLDVGLYSKPRASASIAMQAMFVQCVIPVAKDPCGVWQNISPCCFRMKVATVLHTCPSSGKQEAALAHR